MTVDIPGTPAPAEDEIHVWRARLDRADLPSLRELLSADEHARAERLREPNARDEFVVARGLLRLILSGYAGARPAMLRFRYGPNGKPALEGDDRLRFNVAHSGGILLAAVALGREVGADLERIRPALPWRRIARRFLAPAEADALDVLPDDEGRRAFFACWARKEAFVKARGGRLPGELRDFAVSVEPHDPLPALRTYRDPAEAARWSLRDLDVGPGFAAAVAAAGHGWTIRPLDWSGSGAWREE